MVKKKALKKIKKWFGGKKKAKPSKKKAKKPAIKKKVIKKAPKKEAKFEVAFEEVLIACPSCGRKFKVVKSSKFSTEGMLCQRCAAGGGIGLDDDGDF